MNNGFDPEEITKQVVGKVMSHMEWKFLRQLWFIPPSMTPEVRTLPYLESPVREQIEALCLIANGKVNRNRASEQQVGEVMEMTQNLAEMLYSTPLEGTYSIPPAFWNTDLGQVILHAQLWAREDELITLTEAAILLRGEANSASYNYVRRLIDRGHLVEYRDPHEPNPTKATRLSRQAVMRRTGTEGGDDV